VLEEYLDGVEFDVDLVLEDGTCVFSSVSQNWPTAEPSCQATGPHCPPDHRRRAVRALDAFAADAARAFGFRTGVLHIEAKSTSAGPRIVEIDARMGGGPVDLVVEAVWSRNGAVLGLDVQAQVGEDVVGPEATFATSLGELVVRGRNLREARAISTEMLAEPRRVTADAGAARAL
jgi:hypothetical protein